MADLGFHLPSLVVYLANFTILLVLLYAVGYKPILRMLDQRSERIKESIEEVHRADERASDQQVDLQDKIEKLKDSGSDKTSLVEVNEQIEEIKIKIDKKLNDIYKKLTPWHKLQVARHPERPHFLDYVKILFQDFEPLSGDRLFKEDSALLCGFATFDNTSVMIMGHEKGKNTEDRIKHNFGMAKPCLLYTSPSPRDRG